MPADVVMFPGQGSQHLGMGQDLFAQYPDLCARADEVAGYSIAELCLTDPHRRLDQTAYTQQAIYFVSCLAYLDYVDRFSDRHVRRVLGHSLGLYPALFAAGVFDLFAGLEIVAKRGALMQEAHGGGMVAVMGAGLRDIDEQLVGLEFYDVDIANYNSPDQVVLSAATARIDALVPRLEQAGHRCAPLPVSGAFHSRHMEQARREFARFLLDRDFAPPDKAVVSTTSGQLVDAEHLLEELVFQLVKPVRWWQTVAYLARAGYETFDEVGPGDVLTKLNTRILDGRVSVGAK